jgi:lysozyme
MNDFHMSANGIALIKHFESFVAGAYVCPAGVLTIGYGTTLGVKRGQVVSEKQATALLARDLLGFEAAVKRLVKVQLTQNQFDALVSFAYNCGAANLASSTMLKLINNRQFQLVPAQFLRWNKGGGKVLAGLTRRRRSEMWLWQTGTLKYDFEV